MHATAHNSFTPILHPTIITRTGPQPGKTLAVFAGVHGNETVGIAALERVAHSVTLTAGTVHFVIANPPAVEKNIRQTEKNLNRCFIPGNTGIALEDKLARMLMPLLDGCDALLDLHSSNTPGSPPFIIAEPEAHDLARQLDFEILSWGWDAIEPGATDGYLHRQGKPALCLECGSVDDPAAHVELAARSIYQFLQHFGAIEQQVAPAAHKQNLIEVIKIGIQQTDDFSFTRTFKDFDPLPSGIVFAHDGKITYTAGENECIIFPRDNKKPGDEVFIIGKIKNQ